MPDAPDAETFEQRRSRIAMLRRINSTLPKEQRRPIPPLHEPQPSGPETSTAAAVQSLLTMSRSDYLELVCSDLAAEKDAAWALYLDPRLIQLTHSVLLRKRAAIARLTRDTRESASSEVGRRRWRFIEMLESRIQQVEEALPDAVLTSDRHAAFRLFAAIQAHRRALSAHGVEPEAWDLKLWQTLDGLADDVQPGIRPGEADSVAPVR